jgi:hypothetical protein
VQQDVRHLCEQQHQGLDVAGALAGQQLQVQRRTPDAAATIPLVWETLGRQAQGLQKLQASGGVVV